MKKFIVVLSSLILLGFGCEKNDTPQDGYKLTGTIEGLTGEVYLVNPAMQKVIDTAVVKEGKFEFTGKMTEPDMLMIFNTQKQPVASVYLENTTIGIEGKANDPNSIKVKGSKLSEEYGEVQAIIQKVNTEFKPIEEKLRAEQMTFQGQNPPASFGVKVDSFQKAINTRVETELQKFIKDHSSSPIAALTVNNFFGQGHELKVMEETFAMLSKEAQESKYGKNFAAMLDKEKKWMNTPAPDFTQNDENGKPISLSSYKGKWVLVDFWASWCKPCRAENPNVVKAYAKYKSKNFDILGVSLDQQKDAWVQAIKADNLPWKHVSDLQGWQSSAGRLYGVESIPFNILVNPEGVIVGKNLRGSALEKKLSEVL
ncbi:MAG: AhpC/TSA family protein [Bacteroidia bacterium]|nr:AhpC/TSA family protein [Bacteroidia bacterium]